MSNLSNAVQERIRSEEAYRLEVRRQLKSAEPAYRRWRTFNSPLVIWLLSSIVLGIVSFGYNQLARWQSERMVNETTAAAVFFEAHFRMKQMDTVLARAQCESPVIRTALDLPPGTSPLSKLDLGPFEVHSMV